MSIQIQANWEQTNPASADYIKNKPTLAAVATSGSYNDLTDKPSMAIDNELDASSSNAVSNSIVTSSLEKKQMYLLKLPQLYSLLIGLA